jgi:hypothetical protein
MCKVAAVRALEPRAVEEDTLLPFVVRTARWCDAMSPAEAFADAIIFVRPCVGVYRRRRPRVVGSMDPSIDFLIGINSTSHYS